MSLSAAGRPIFLGLPVSCGLMRGALIKEVRIAEPREEHETS